MDIETFLSHLCNELARGQANLRHLRAWYIFEDKRPGSPVERFTRDARNFTEFITDFRGHK